MPSPPSLNRARRLRRTATPSERAAWTVLRKLRKLGFPARRQHVIAGYIVDFAIIRAKLVLEIDGGVHSRDVAGDADAVRQVAIEKEGWRMLRFSPEEAADGDFLFSRVAAVLGL